MTLTIDMDVRATSVASKETGPGMEAEALEPSTLVPSQLSSSTTSRSHAPLAPYDLFGWRPDPSLTDDENYMDMVLLITRHSVCDWQGHMGSIVVDPTHRASTTTTTGGKGRGKGGKKEGQDDKEEGDDDDDDDEKERAISNLERRLYSSVLGAATNSPLYDAHDSDLHAEIDALGQACRSGTYHSPRCTVYVTMPPCRRCFAALVAFGVGRVVSRKLPPDKIQRVAKERGMELVELTAEERRRQMLRINGLVNGNRTDEDLMKIVEDRKRRKEERRRKGEEKMKKKKMAAAEEEEEEEDEK